MILLLIIAAALAIPAGVVSYIWTRDDDGEIHPLRWLLAFLALDLIAAALIHGALTS